jgi:hypothetical protein
VATHRMAAALGDTMRGKEDNAQVCLLVRSVPYGPPIGARARRGRAIKHDELSEHKRLLVISEHLDRPSWPVKHDELSEPCGSMPWVQQPAQNDLSCVVLAHLACWHASTTRNSQKLILSTQ